MATDSPLNHALRTELAKYVGPLRRRIEVLHAAGVPSKSSRYSRSAEALTKYRQYELSCGHLSTDRCAVGEKFPARSVGDVVLCEGCGGSYAAGSIESIRGNALLHLLAARTGATWAPLFTGPHDSRSLWERLKPLLKPEVVDPRLDVYFALQQQMQKIGYESTESHEARMLATLPALIEVVMRDPVQEPAAPAATAPKPRARKPKAAEGPA